MHLKRAVYSMGIVGSAAVLAFCASGSAQASSGSHAWNNSPSTNECLATSEDQVGQNAIMWTCDSEPGQQWTFSHGTDDGAQTIETSQGCLDGRNYGQGSRIYVMPCNGGTTQEWIGKVVGGSSEWMNYQTGWCLSVAGGSTANGATVISCKCQETPDQLWAGSLA